MVDKDKVIKGLEHCDKESDCRSCIYSKQMQGRYKSYRCDCIADALALLKEQEEKRAKVYEILEKLSDITVGIDDAVLSAMDYVMPEEERR